MILDTTIKAMVLYQQIDFPPILLKTILLRENNKTIIERTIDIRYIRHCLPLFYRSNLQSPTPVAPLHF